MSRKPKAQWGEYGFTDEVSPFRLTEERREELAEMLGIEDPTRRNSLAEKIQSVGNSYRCDKALEAVTPARAERNAALAAILATARELEFQLQGIDHASQSELWKALGTEPFWNDEDSGTQNGFEQYESLRRRLTHLTRTLAPHVEEMKRGGRPENAILKTAVGELIDLYEEFTENDDKRFTHTVHVNGAHVGKPQSPGGRFIVNVFREIDDTVAETSIGSAIRDRMTRKADKDTSSF